MWHVMGQLFKICTAGNGNILTVQNLLSLLFSIARSPQEFVDNLLTILYMAESLGFAQRSPLIKQVIVIGAKLGSKVDDAIAAKILTEDNWEHGQKVIMDGVLKIARKGTTSTVDENTVFNEATASLH